MTRRRYIDRDGRLVDDSVALDARGVLKDGYGLRTPMQFMDAEQRRVARDARRRKVVERDPMGRVRSTFAEEEEEGADAMTTDAQLALHRPGYRTSTRVNDDAAVEAYRQYVADQASAWKKHNAQPPPGAYPLSAGVGTACTINGAPGVLVESDDGQCLVCKPAARQDGAPTGPVFDAAEGQRIKDAAWQQMVDEQREAWRKR
jgi:hypothetical protein